VVICGQQFWQAYRENPFRVEALVIHEMLHTLGLGENPPSAMEIDARCSSAAGSPSEGVFTREIGGYPPGISRVNRSLLLSTKSGQFQRMVVADHHRHHARGDVG